MSIQQSVANEMEGVEKMKKILSAREEATNKHFDAKLAKMNEWGKETDKRIARENAAMAGVPLDEIGEVVGEVPAPEVVAAADVPDDVQQPVEVTPQVDYAEKLTRTVNR